MKKKYDYTDKNVFIGIDVHKKTYSITAICDGLIVKRDTLIASPDVLINYCKKFFAEAKGIKTAYEAGFSGFHLHRRLVAEGIVNLVVDAAGIEIASGDRVKTDKRDSLKIATHLSEGRLRSIFIPSPEQEDRRIVTRLRETFVKQCSRLACQLKSLLHQFGLIRADDKKKVSLKWIAAFYTLSLPVGLKFAMDQFVSLWLHMKAKIKEIDLELAEQAKQNSCIDAVYRSVCGIGPTSARIFANELGDTLQFSNERRLFSYVGLTPCEHSSGEHTRQGHITRQGKPVLRKILVQVAWKAIKRDPSLKEIYERISKRAGKKRAIIGVARRIIGRVRHCFRTGELYCIPVNENTKEANNCHLATV